MLFYIKQGSSPSFSSSIKRQMTCQTSGAPDFIMDWRNKNFAFGESIGSRSCSMDSPETRKDQIPGTDGTPESAICEVEGHGSSSPPLRPCNKGGIGYMAEKKSPLDEVVKQSTRRLGSEEDIVCVGAFNNETSSMVLLFCFNPDFT